LIAGIALSNPSEGVGVFVRFADSGLSDSLVTRSEESYRVCVCVCLIVCNLETSKSGDLGPSWAVAHKLYVFSGFHCEVDENCEVLKL
jgi:hypothetical protein